MKLTLKKKKHVPDEEDVQSVNGRLLFRPGRGIDSMVVTLQEQAFTVESDGALRVYDLISEEMETQSDPIKALSLQIEESNVFAVTKDNTVVAWSLENNNYYITFKGHTKWITTVLLEDSLLYTASADGTIRSWDANIDVEAAEQGATAGAPRRRKNLGKFFGDQGGVEVPMGAKTSAVYCGPSNNKGKEIRETRESRCVFRGHKDVVIGLTLGSHMLFSSSSDKTIRIWNPKMGECLKVLAGHEDWVYCLRYVDNKLISGSKDKTIRFWDIHSGECQQVLKMEFGVTSLKVKRDLMYITSSASSEYTIKALNVHTGKVQAVFEGHTNKIKAVKIYGEFLFTASADATVRQWNARTGACIAVYRGHTDVITCISKRKATNNIFTSSSDGTIRVWDVMIPETTPPITTRGRRNTLTDAGPPPDLFDTNITRKLERQRSLGDTEKTYGEKKKKKKKFNPTGDFAGKFKKKKKKQKEKKDS